eukprot:5271907-Amphidinium_carterae.1
MLPKFKEGSHTALRQLEECKAAKAARSSCDYSCLELSEFGTHAHTHTHTHIEIQVLLKEHGWHKTRIETCAIRATCEGKPVKQTLQVIAPGTFYTHRDPNVTQ